MKKIFDDLAIHKLQFEKLPLMRRFETTSATNESLSVAARSITFLVLVVQDVLRISAAKFKDPVLARMAQAHRREEMGHDIWHLKDLENIGVPAHIGNFFSHEHAGLRDAVYQLVWIATSDIGDAARVALIYSIEETGDVYFSRAKRHCENLEHARPLLHFGGTHLRAEQDHEIHTDGMHQRLMGLELSEAEEDEALSVVRRAYGAFTAIMEESEAAIARANTSTAGTGLVGEMNGPRCSATP